MIKPNLAQVVDNKQGKQKILKDLKCKRDRPFTRTDRVCIQTQRLLLRLILCTVIKFCGPRAHVDRPGHKTRYVHTDHMIKAHDDVPDDISEPEVPESCDQMVTDGGANPVDSISMSHVNSSENGEAVASPTVESSPQMVFQRSRG